MSKKPRTKAIIYDLDGVLVDAADWHYEALNKALVELYGIPVDRETHLAHYNGKPTRVKLEMLQKIGLVEKKDIPYLITLKQAYTKQAIELFARPNKAKLTLHRNCKKLGLKLGCATNSIRDTAHLMLNKTQQIKFIDVILTNQDVFKPKPDPEIYLSTMRKLGVNPNQTIIVEDSAIGVQAAMATGARVVIAKTCDEVNWNNIKKHLV